MGTAFLEYKSGNLVNKTELLEMKLYRINLSYLIKPLSLR
jgi:hypothetical protein